jgi:hypothetical protein
MASTVALARSWLGLRRRIEDLLAFCFTTKRVNGNVSFR